MVPVMPRPVIEEAWRSGLQCMTKCGLSLPTEHAADVRPGSKDHDSAEKEWHVREGLIR